MSDTTQQRAVRLLEALLFLADDGAPHDRLRTALGVTPEGLDELLRLLAAELETRGLRLQRESDRAMLVTAPEFAREIEDYLGLPVVQRLSHAALEALAVVAYRQPTTRAQVEAVRGVDSGAVLQTLLARGLIEEVGRQPGPGQPLLYTTTAEFLQHFGLASLEDLPAVAGGGGQSLDEIWERRQRARQERRAGASNRDEAGSGA